MTLTIALSYGGRTELVDACRALIRDGVAADDVDEGSGVVVVTDMFGGSPSNLSLLACRPEDRKILYGANLPMLIKLAKSRHKPLDAAVAAALAAGRKYIDSFDGPGE